MVDFPLPLFFFFSGGGGGYIIFHCFCGEEDPKKVHFLLGTSGIFSRHFPGLTPKWPQTTLQGGPKKPVISMEL